MGLRQGQIWQLRLRESAERKEQRNPPRKVLPELRERIDPIDELEEVLAYVRVPTFLYDVFLSEYTAGEFLNLGREGFEAAHAVRLERTIEIVDLAKNKILYLTLEIGTHDGPAKFPHVFVNRGHVSGRECGLRPLPWQ